ncbi:hypothetical protein Sango_1617400 [Sesamum angolense]|uniref:Uncharacterized protein n=1 Tax=Sesamum angolense TaxID=2727404 RepID=A0AAE1WJT6_9LAMI|nr:hypothetical protein Sango_1617400 [Sesamum angolense]
MESREFSRQSSDPIIVDEALFQSRSRRCCCFFPCFDSPGNSSPSPAVVGLTWWQKIRAVSETGSSNSLWARGVGALKKIREWSEIVAGPRWKTFIRRFNRNRSGGSRHVNFQYELRHELRRGAGTKRSIRRRGGGRVLLTQLLLQVRQGIHGPRQGRAHLRLTCAPAPLSCAKERIVLESDGCLLARLRTQLNYC